MLSFTAKVWDKFEGYILSISFKAKVTYNI
jgi:hypothetical protein